MREALRAARASVMVSGGQIAPAFLPPLLREWGALLAHRVGKVVGDSIFNRVLAQRGITLASADPGDLSSLLEGLVETASVFLSKEESGEFAAALAKAAREWATKEGRP